MKHLLWQSALIAVLLVGAGSAGAASYSLASLNGTCIWQALYVSTTSGDQADAGPASNISRLNFNGSGTLTLTFYDVNINGVYSSTASTPGTYTVDSTGHGSFSYTSPATGKPQTYDFRISPQGHLIRTITSSFNNQALSPRIAPGVCNFNE